MEQQEPPPTLCLDVLVIACHCSRPLLHLKITEALLELPESPSLTSLPWVPLPRDMFPGRLTLS